MQVMAEHLERLEREVRQGTLRTKNRKREHEHHGWTQIRQCGSIVLMECPCGWLGWVPAESI